MLYSTSANTLLYAEFEGNLNDSSGNGNNSTKNTGIGYSTVSGQQVLRIANTGGAIMFNPQSFSSIGTGDFTICFRAYLVNPTSGYGPQIFGIWSDYNSSVLSNPGPLIFFHRSGTNRTLFRMLGGSDNLGEKFYSTDTRTLEYNKWHHRSMIRRSGVVYCFIDGELLGSFNSTRNIITSSTLQYFNFLGRNEGLLDEGGTGYSTAGWNATGSMGDKLIVEKAGWSNADLLNYYNKTKSQYGY